MKNIAAIIDHFEQLNIQVSEYKEDKKLCGYELNTYTDGGVNMILFLDFRFNELNPKKTKDFIRVFNDIVNDIDIEEEIELHRKDKRYCDAFTLKESLVDFEAWKNGLKNVFSESRGATLISKKDAQKRQFEQVVDKLRSQLAEMEETLKLMPTKGNSKNDCQKINILHHLNQLDYCINGIELEDFTPNEYSLDFKLSYS